MTTNTTTAEQRLKQLGIELPVPPEPFGTYVEAVQTGNLLFLTRMLPTEGRLRCGPPSLITNDDLPWAGSGSWATAGPRSSSVLLCRCESHIHRHLWHLLHPPWRGFRRQQTRIESAQFREHFWQTPSPHPETFSESDRQIYAL
jgi:hypothetical protein